MTVSSAPLFLLVGGLLGCQGLDAPKEPDSDRAPVQLVALPNAAVDDVEPGQTVELAVQVLDVNGEAIDGVQVYMLRTDERLRFAGSEDQVLQTTTGRRSYGRLTASGLAIVTVMVGEDAQSGSVRVVTGLAQLPSDNPKSGIASFDLRIAAPPKDEADASVGSETGTQ